jgi:hypothetical protein
MSDLELSKPTYEYGRDFRLGGTDIAPPTGRIAVASFLNDNGELRRGVRVSFDSPDIASQTQALDKDEDGLKEHIDTDWLAQMSIHRAIGQSARRQTIKAIEKLKELARG